MKNAIALFLLVIFTFNIGGSYLLFRIRQFEIRREIIQEIKQGIRESDLTIFTITPENEDQINWENTAEFSYKGTMYDVVHVETIDQNTKRYHCISDIQETKLIANYGKELEKNKGTKNTERNSLRFLKFFQEQIPSQSSTEIAFFNQEPSSNFKYFNGYTPLFLEISSPPPKQVL